MRKRVRLRESDLHRIVKESVKKALKESDEFNSDLKEYNVLVGISGVASTIIKARSPQEAKQIAIEQRSFGDNDYYWWYDTNNPTIAISDTEMMNPDVTDINMLRSDDEWHFV